MSEDFSTWLTATAAALGACAAGCVRLDNQQLKRELAEHGSRVSRWLAAGHHGRMGYLERMAADKADPRRRFPFARSVIVLTFANPWGAAGIEHPFPSPSEGAPVGYLSAYARGTDYHRVGHQMLKSLHQQLGAHFEAEAAVDTEAVCEVLLARVAGLGVNGHNGLLRTGEQGTRVFIGCLFVAAELPEVIRQPRMPFCCTDCRACLDKCPTGAIAADRPIDARRCISYLTIEKPGLLRPDEETAMGDWLFGCDGCTAICPPAAADLRVPVDLEWLLTSTAGTVRRALRDNAAAYAGVTRLRRNAVAVLKNLGSPEAAKLLRWVGAKTGSDLVREQVDQ